MRTTNALLVALLLGSSALAAGCGGTAADINAQSASQAASRAPLQAKADGPLGLVADAFADVPLRPAQRAEIESLVVAANERHAKLAPLHETIMNTLADQVEKGALDEAALGAQVGAGLAAFRPINAENRKAAERVHAILDADQRVALVDAIEAKRHERFGKVLAAAAGAGGPPPDEAMGRGHGPPGPFAMMHELALTPEQKVKLMDAMRAEIPMPEGGGGAPNDGARKERGHGQAGPRGQGGMGHHGKVLAAFKSDHFVMDEIAPQGEMEKHMQKGFEHAVRFAKAALPILTVEQRATAARLLRERANRGGPGPEL